MSVSLVACVTLSICLYSPENLIALLQMFDAQSMNDDEDNFGQALRYHIDFAIASAHVLYTPSASLHNILE